MFRSSLVSEEIGLIRLFARRLRSLFRKFYFMAGVPCIAFLLNPIGAQAYELIAPKKWGLLISGQLVLGDTAAEVCDQLDDQYDYTAQPPFDVTGPSQVDRVYDVTQKSNCVRTYPSFYGKGVAGYGNYCPLPGVWSQGTKKCEVPECPEGTKLDTPSDQCWPIVQEDDRSKEPAQCPGFGNPIYPLTGSKRETVDTQISIGGLPITITYDTNRLRCPLKFWRSRDQLGRMIRALRLDTVFSRPQVEYDVTLKFLQTSGVKGSMIQHEGGQLAGLFDQGPLVVSDFRCLEAADGGWYVYLELDSEQSVEFSFQDCIQRQIGRSSLRH